MNLIRALESGSMFYNCRPGRRQHFSIVIFALCALFLLTSCNSKKYLSEDQSFLFGNNITVKSKHKIDDKSDLKEKLTALYRQRATRTVAGLPRHMFYYQYLERMARDSIRRAELASKGLPVPKGRKRWSEERIIKNRPV